MRLYHKMPKRLAKKILGSKRWNQLQFGRNLKPGDLISSPLGYNERIKEVKPEYSANGSLVWDFDIITESGTLCSLYDCIFPVKTKEQVLEYWKVPSHSFYSDRIKEIIQAVSEGKEVFDADGQPLYDFCEEHEKEARFPEREWAGARVVEWNEKQTKWLIDNLGLRL